MWKIEIHERDKVSAVVTMVINFMSFTNSPVFILAEELSGSRKIISLV
jgi:hypothetical protein